MARARHEVVAFRIAGATTPFWVDANGSSGRYNRSTTGPVQYWSLHPLTPWAEFMRGLGVRDDAGAETWNYRLWAARFPLAGVVDLDFNSAWDYGLEPDYLVADEHGPCQEFGDRCAHEAKMPKAIRVPSAALPGTTNLVLFGPLVLSPYTVDPIGPEDMPATVAADAARPPPGLASRVVQRGDSHPALTSWKAGQPYRFIEPPVPSRLV